MVEEYDDYQRSCRPNLPQAELNAFRDLSARSRFPLLAHSVICCGCAKGYRDEADIIDTL